MIGKITKNITPALISVGGGVAANFAGNKIGFLNKMDPKLKHGLMFLAGLFVAAQGGDTMKQLGSGIATVSGMKLAGTVIPSMAGVTGVHDDVLNGVYDEVLEGLGDDDEDVSGDGNDDEQINDDVMNGYGDDDGDGY